MLGLVVGLSLFGIGIDLGAPTAAQAQTAPIECQVTGSLVCSNRPPTARIETTGSSEMSVTVCDRSSDPEGAPLTRRWQFGDGATSTAECPTHTYRLAGEYTIALRVEDDAGQSDSTSTTFRAQAAAGPSPSSTSGAQPTAGPSGSTGTGANGTSTGTNGKATRGGATTASGGSEGQAQPGSTGAAGASVADPPMDFTAEDRHLWRKAIAPLVVQGDSGVSLRTVAATGIGMALLFIPPLWLLMRRRRRDRSAEFERLTNDFISNVSHELRTPLTPVRGYAEMLGSKRLPKDKARTAASAILSASERLERVIDNLVDVAEIDSGHAQVDATDVDLGELAVEVVSTWRQRQPERIFRVDGEGTVRGSHRLLAIAVDQLIDNAVKFSPAGSEVVVELGQNRIGYAIAVTDHGEGIEPQHLDTIFADFRQGDGSATREHGGLGLGLALVRRVARAHGGDVTVRSMPGVGSTFTLTIPAARTRRRRGAGAQTVERSPVRT
jgi:signal transduction histidine kinase